MLEVEQKFPIGDRRQFEARLVALEAQFEDAVHQRDLYFAHPARDFHRTDEAVRIRRDGTKTLITYKGPKIDPETKTRREIELPLGDSPDTFGNWKEILLALGFTPVDEVRKQRRPLTVQWQGWKFSGAIDQVERLGTFAELEVVVDDTQAAAAKRALLSLSARLGLTTHERRSYLELLGELKSR